MSTYNQDDIYRKLEDIDTNLSLINMDRTESLLFDLNSNLEDVKKHLESIDDNIKDFKKEFFRPKNKSMPVVFQFYLGVLSICLIHFIVKYW